MSDQGVTLSAQGVTLSAQGVTLSAAKGTMPAAGPFGALRVTMALLTGTALACHQPSRTETPFHLTTAAVGPDTRVTLHAGPHLKINARLAPALELADGAVLRFAADRLTPDSAYFAGPPSAVLAGHHDQVHGTLRVSVCREDERVCRSLTVEL